ncbi:MAG: hypothetical protein JJU42_02760, partial [Rhodobacteraceae bacterium]|nr:hypothetical protein [Paracoccaceae bacterium]
EHYLAKVRVVSSNLIARSISEIENGGPRGPPFSVRAPAIAPDTLCGGPPRMTTRLAPPALARGSDAVNRSAGKGMKPAACTKKKPRPAPGLFRVPS